MALFLAQNNQQGNLEYFLLSPLLGHTLLHRNMVIGAKITVVVLILRQAKRRAVKYRG